MLKAYVHVERGGGSKIKKSEPTYFTDDPLGITVQEKILFHLVNAQDIKYLLFVDLFPNKKWSSYSFPSDCC